MGSSVEDFNVSDFVKHIQVQKALIIHDKNDKVLPIHISKKVFDNWQNCDFEEVEGTGHFRILRTKKVLDKVLTFLD